MSICSDVYITREKAEKMVKSRLMYEQERLIDLAVKSMGNFDLSGYINEEGSIYYYNIEDDSEDEDEEDIN